jgi:CBS domain-containing protein
MAAGLPTVRSGPSERRALDAADREPPTCRPDQLVNDLPPLASDTAFVVINERRVVLGRYRTGGESRAGGVRVEEVMEPGPTTVRAHEPLDPLLERMARRGVDEVIMTTPEGELLGVVRRTKGNS